MTTWWLDRRAGLDAEPIPTGVGPAGSAARRDVCARRAREAQARGEHPIFEQPAERDLLREQLPLLVELAGPEDFWQLAPTKPVTSFPYFTEQARKLGGRRSGRRRRLPRGAP